MIVVVAADLNNGIGFRGEIPWHLSGDLSFMRRITTTTVCPKRRNIVLIGRKSWEAIPQRHRPLRDRLCIVISRDAEFRKDLDTAVGVPRVWSAGSVVEALALIRTDETLTTLGESIMVLGGSEIYRECLASPQCDKVYLTRVGGEFECDTYFPVLDAETWNDTTPSGVRQVENGIYYQHRVFERRGSAAVVHPNAEEKQYLDLVREIITMGVQREDRTGTGTLAVFGRQMRFSLRGDRFPLLTTKRVFWRGVAEELLWFISGRTNAHELSDKGVRIWEGNGSRAFLDQLGLTSREEGDLGPVYGFQWRHYGAAYSDMHADYSGCGVDQLRWLINRIRTHPTCRRLVLTAWNPAALHEMALPPCHMFAQFFVANGELSCQMYQRSCDMGLGVPFNIASYALLTRLIAQATGLRSGDLVHVLGDAHVYENHVEPLEEQLKREPTQFPTLRINPSITDIDQFRFEHFELCGYLPQSNIKMNMAI